MWQAKNTALDKHKTTKIITNEDISTKASGGEYGPLDTQFSLVMETVNRPLFVDFGKSAQRCTSRGTSVEMKHVVSARAAYTKCGDW